MPKQLAARVPESPRRATYQDVLDAPPHKVAEIIEGVLHMNPRPAPPHAWAAIGLGESIGPPFNRGRGGPGGWRIFIEPELHLGEDIIVPDLAGWRRERMPALPETSYIALAPDWVCEIPSSSTRAMDIGPKRAIYAREGVGRLWFVDPEIRTLEAFELKDGHWSLLDVVSGNSPVSLPPFDAVTFGLGDLWSDDGADDRDTDESGDDRTDEGNFPAET